MLEQSDIISDPISAFLLFEQLFLQIKHVKVTICKRNIKAIWNVSTKLHHYETYKFIIKNLDRYAAKTCMPKVLDLVIASHH